MKLWIESAFAVLLGMGTACAPRQAEFPSSEQELVLRCLGIRYPYAMTQWVGYGDGGSITGVITDAAGKELNFWWDQRLRLPGTSSSTPPGCIYLGAKVPADPAGLRLDVGSECETAFIETLHAIANDQFSKARQDSLYGTLYDVTVPMRQRKPEFDALKPAELMALRALALAKSLEGQRLPYL